MPKKEINTKEDSDQQAQDIERQMRACKENHPIRKVRNIYLRSGFRQLSTTAGFAQLIGCSDSLIRNTESGVIPLSSKLSQRIENATGVSAQWLKEIAEKQRAGEDVSKERVLNTDKKPWYPSRENRFHFTDELLDISDLIYQRCPELLAPFMGAMFEALLVTDPPPIRPHQSPSVQRLTRRSYLDCYLLPFLRLVGDFEGDERERFFKVFIEGLELRDANIGGGRLLALWNGLHTRNNNSPNPQTQLMVPRIKESHEINRVVSKLEKYSQSSHGMRMKLREP